MPTACLPPRKRVRHPDAPMTLVVAGSWRDPADNWRPVMSEAARCPPKLPPPPLYPGFSSSSPVARFFARQPRLHDVPQSDLSIPTPRPRWPTDLLSQRSPIPPPFSGRDSLSRGDNLEFSLPHPRPICPFPFFIPSFPPRKPCTILSVEKNTKTP
jgi:hypothetical protein